MLVSLHVCTPAGCVMCGLINHPESTPHVLSIFLSSEAISALVSFFGGASRPWPCTRWRKQTHTNVNAQVSAWRFAQRPRLQWGASRRISVEMRLFPAMCILKSSRKNQTKKTTDIVCAHATHCEDCDLPGEGNCATIDDQRHNVWRTARPSVKH